MLQPFIIYKEKMLTKKFKKVTGDIKHFGLSGFVLLKLTENIYTRKFKRLGIVHPGRQFKIQDYYSVNNDSRKNESSAYYLIKKGIEITGINHKAIHLLDVGCGDGRVLNFGILLNFKQVTGIDLDGAALAKATANCRKLQKKGYTTAFHIHHQDACTYQIPAGTNLIFMFNPFGEKTMQAFLENIIRYATIDKTDLYVVYVVPVHRKIFAGYKQFIKVAEKFNRNNTVPEIAVFKIAHQ